MGQASVPRVSIVLRKGYGGGYYAMGGGSAFDNNATFAWPTAEICAMSVEGSVDVAYRKDFEAAEDPAARRQEIIDIFKSQLGARRAAEAFGIDEVVDPISIPTGCARFHQFRRIFMLAKPPTSPSRPPSEYH